MSTQRRRELLKSSKEVEPFMCLGSLTSFSACPTNGEISEYSEDAKWESHDAPHSGKSHQPGSRAKLGT